ncbi:MAG: response regulator [Myxococcota bacterium]
MNTERLNILIVDDEPEIRELLVEYLTTLGHQVRESPDGRTAQRILRDEAIDVVLTDVRMQGKPEGVDLIAHLEEREANLGVVVMTGFPTVQSVISAMRYNASDYILKPFSLREVHAALQKAASRSRLERKAARLQHTLSFYEVAQAAMEAEDLGEVFVHLSEAACAETAATSFRLWLPDDAGEWAPLSPVVLVGKSERLVELDPTVVEAPRVEQGFAAVPVITTDLARRAVFAVAGGGVGASQHLDRLRALGRALGQT